MSIKLVSTNPDYLEHGADPGVSYPFAIGLWFNPTALNLDMVLASIADASVEDNFHALLFKGTIGTNRVHAISDDAEAIGTAAVSSANVWYHVLGVWESASDRKIYLNGANEGTDTTAKTITGLDTLTVGRLGKLTPTNPTAGRVAHLSIWNLSTVLTTEERSQLGIVGVSPLLVRADELISYTPMPTVDTDPVVDVVGGFHLTQFGSPTTGEDGPPVLLPVPGQPEPPQISAINVEIIQNIGFGQSALNNIKQGSGAHDLLLADEALNNIKQGAGAHNLLFGDAALNNIKQGAGSSDILFEQVEANNVIFGSASNSIAFGNLPIITNLKIISVGNDILFGGNPAQERDIEIISSFSFFHDAFSNVKFLQVQSSFAIGSVQASGGHELCKSFIQQFLFESTANRSIVEAVGNSILFGQEAARAGQGLSQLLLDGVVTYDQCKHLINEILFDHSVSFSHDRSYSLGNSCLWAGTVVGALDSNCGQYDYNPNGAMPNIVLGVRAGVRLESGAFNIELRNPEFGNGDSVDPKRVLRRTRGGTIQIVRDPIWPKKTTIQMDFTTITRLKALALLTFLSDTLGQQVTLTDQENQTWDGIITTPDAGIGDLQGGQDCSYAAQVTFIGERT